MLKKRPIIIDTDPGIDDAVALAIALHDETLDVKLITTVGGNVSLEKVTDNTLKLLTFWGKKVPVAKGAREPLIIELTDASNVHGESGLQGYEFDVADESNLLKENAIVAMQQVIMSSEDKVTLVPIGPLTNIALLLKTFPEVKANIKEIILMGGSTTRGNKGVLSEFNIATDPEAAKIVFNSKLPIVMVGLDVGWKALLLAEDTDVIRQLNQTGDMLYKLFKQYRGGSLKTGLKMYDGCAIAYLLKPEMFNVANTYVDIELAGAMTYGVTVVDLKGYLKKENNAKVCLDIDEQLFKEWIVNSLKKCT